MATVRSLLAELALEVGQVQHRSLSWVCDVCMGPVRDGLGFCVSCQRWVDRGVPASLLDRVMPATIAPNPGRWYSRLMTYKGGNPPYRGHVAAVAWAFVERHEHRLADLAGGPIEIVTPVPSKKGRSFADQPLCQALAAVKPIQDRLAETLRFQAAEGIDLRKDYYPGCFDAGARVLLVEDSWVTGATALSAGGALLRAGAASVVTLSIARVLDVEYWRAQGGGPYLDRVLDSRSREPYNVDLWRR